MRPLLFVIHNHQPVGNFDHVIRDAFERCYRPVLELLHTFSAMKVGMHFSGPLFEWMEEHDSRLFDRIGSLVDRGQMEILGGGFYEPILSILPDEDARGQLEWMADYCERRFGRRPRGLWLAERVWDPDLPRVLASAGFEYTFVDDAFFRASGMLGSAVAGHYVTEKAGRPLVVFPIDRKLRYIMPWAPIEEALAYLTDTPEEGALVYADDGEKFGLWPTTFDWAFERGGLARFFDALSEADARGQIRLSLPGQYVDANAPKGRVYLPNGSYEEMMEWALPAAAGRRLRGLKRLLETRKELELYRGHVWGGIWQNFLSRYSEANQIHKRMLEVSRRVQSTAPGTRVEVNSNADAASRTEEAQILQRWNAARRDLYRAQCCCAYWHGLFGGLYLNHLRTALYAAMLRAECVLDVIEHGEGDWMVHEELDFDLDGHPEIIVRTRTLNVYFRPDCGGCLAEIDYKPRAFQVTDVLTRREESYHDSLNFDLSPEALDSAEPPQGSELSNALPSSDHSKMDRQRQLQATLTYDALPRRSFVDRFFSSEPEPNSLKDGVQRDAADFSGARYEIERAWEPQGTSTRQAGEPEDAFDLRLVRKGLVETSAGSRSVLLVKNFKIDKVSPRITAHYQVVNLSEAPLETWFGVELNLTLLAGHDPMRYLILEGDPDQHFMDDLVLGRACQQATLVDEWNKFKLIVGLEQPATVTSYPVYTVSRAEFGVDRTYQGTCLMSSWLVLLPPKASLARSLTLAFA